MHITPNITSTRLKPSPVSRKHSLRSDIMDDSIRQNNYFSVLLMNYLIISNLRKDQASHAQHY